MSEIVIFEPTDGGHVTVRLEGDSLWLTQLALLVSESAPRQKETILRLIENMLVKVE
jgi:hypothetical protein